VLTLKIVELKSNTKTS